MRANSLLILLGGCSLLASCSRPAAKTSVAKPDPCAIALASENGTLPIDAEIRALQAQLRKSPQDAARLEQLGWKFVAKARLSNDAGYYRIAESCAVCLRQHEPGNAGALLLQGHVLTSLHHFKEAEAIARELIAQREVPFDFALLGDALMEQGRLAEAVEAYQKMADLKPGYQAYTRIAHVRWLTGDLAGATEIMAEAVRACSLRDVDSMAWACSKLALYQLQSGDPAQALATVARGLAIYPEHAGSLVTKARILLAQNRTADVLPLLRRGMELNPSPETGWLLSDVLRASGAEAEADGVEKHLQRDGQQLDPRSYALYLATRGEQPELALTMVGEELNARADIFTVDALAWALKASGRTADAQREISKSLAEGTQDARLFFHAGMIAAAGKQSEALPLLQKAAAISQMLYPSERAQLTGGFAALGAPMSVNQPIK